MLSVNTSNFFQACDHSQKFCRMEIRVVTSTAPGYSILFNVFLLAVVTVSSAAVASGFLWCFCCQLLQWPPTQGRREGQGRWGVEEKKGTCSGLLSPS